MDYLLCIESTAEFCSVSVFENESCIYTIHATEKHAHSSSLAVIAKECLAESGVSAKDLKGIGLAAGPGSYTGLRVGASIAKGMCYALRIPLITMDSLAIIAQPYINDKQNRKIIIPTIDARRDEAYIRIYLPDGQLHSDSQPHIFTSSSFASLDSATGIVVCGNAANKAKGLLMHLTNANFEQTLPSSEEMGTTIFRKYLEKNFADTAYFEPNYIKSPNITTQKKPLIS